VLILLALMVRRHRVQIASWLVLLVALTSATVSAYQSTYSTPEQRRTATELAQHDPATTLMYGHLADPGSAALMFAWEMGAIATIFGCNHGRARRGLLDPCRGGRRNARSLCGRPESTLAFCFAAPR
jgi:hypothetical protein